MAHQFVQDVLMEEAEAEAEAEMAVGLGSRSLFLERIRKRLR